jgi:hypothetical protein
MKAGVTVAASGGTFTNGSISITNPSPSNVVSNHTSTGSSAGYMFHNSNITSNTIENSLKVHGNADIHGDLTINGKSMLKALEAIEAKLAILTPNIELEEKWGQLKELRKAYMDLESEIKEKQKIWGILQK